MYHVTIKKEIVGLASDFKEANATPSQKATRFTKWLYGEFGKARYLLDELSDEQVKCLQGIKPISALLAGLAVKEGESVFNDLNWMLENINEDLDDDFPEEMIEDLFGALATLSSAIEADGACVVRCANTGAIFGAVSGKEAAKVSAILGASIVDVPEWRCPIDVGDRFEKYQEEKGETK